MAVALAFVAMGVAVISLAGSTTMTGNATWFQRLASDGVTRTAEQVLGRVAPVPEPLLGLGLLALAASFVWFTLRDRNRRTPTAADEAADDTATHPCHEHTDAPRQGVEKP